MNAIAHLHVARDFARWPAGRYVTDGPNSGERLRELLVHELDNAECLVVFLDGTAGYAASFLDEAFGSLVRLASFTADDLHRRLDLRASEPRLVQEIWSYIDA